MAGQGASARSASARATSARIGPAVATHDEFERMRNGESEEMTQDTDQKGNLACALAMDSSIIEKFGIQLLWMSGSTTSW